MSKKTVKVAKVTKVEGGSKRELGLTPKEALKFLAEHGVQLSEPWLRAMRASNGKFQPPSMKPLPFTKHRITGRIGYKKSDLLKFVRDNYK